jgi:lipase chaperone LimK
VLPTASEACFSRKRVLYEFLVDATREFNIFRGKARLPEHVEREQALAPLRLWQDEQALRAKGATPEEIRALRERRFGKEAADRLMDLDRQRAEWQDRLDAYHHERQRILSDPRLSEDERSKALRDLMTGSFTPPKRIRLQALDRIQAEGKEATRGPSAGP